MSNNHYEVHHFERPVAASHTRAPLYTYTAVERRNELG